MFQRILKRAAVLALVLCMSFALLPVTASAKSTTKTTKSTKKSKKKSTKKKTKITKKDLIYFGDCRTLGLGQTIYGYSAGSSNYKGYVSETIYAAHCVAKVGANRLWAKDVGIYQVYAQLKKNPDAYVICNFGMNDLNWYGYGRTTAANEKTFAAEYVNIYKKIKARYPKAHIVLMSLNPVTGSGAKRDNTLMSYFNSYLKKAAKKNGWIYINTNSLSVFKKGSSYAGDGVHYSSSAYRAIHKAVLKKLKKSA